MYLLLRSRRWPEARAAPGRGCAAGMRRKARTGAGTPGSRRARVRGTRGCCPAREAAEAAVPRWGRAGPVSGETAGADPDPVRWPPPPRQWAVARGCASRWVAALAAAEDSPAVAGAAAERPRAQLG